MGNRSNRETQRRLQRRTSQLTPAYEAPVNTDTPLDRRVQVPDLRMEIFPDASKKCVVYQYNRRIWWLAVKPDEARRMAERLMWCADQAEGKRVDTPAEAKIILP